jgi:hypothetical protein
MPRPLESYFPDIIPDRPEDEPTTNRRLRREGDHKLWYPTGTRRGLALASNRGETNEIIGDTVSINLLGRINLGPVLEFLGIETSIYRGEPTDETQGHDLLVTAMRYPNAAFYCKLNVLEMNRYCNLTCAQVRRRYSAIRHCWDMLQNSGSRSLPTDVKPGTTKCMA